MNLKEFNRVLRFSGGLVKITVIAILIALYSFSALIADDLGFTVISEGEDFTEIEFTMPEYETYTVEYDGITYQRLYHPEHGLIMEEGLPEIISFSFLLSIPSTGIVKADELKIYESEVVKGIKLFPSQGFDLEIDEEKGFLISEEFYKKDVDYPHKPIQISSPAIMRGMRLVAVNVNPISYNPAREELTLSKKLTLRISYDISVEGENEVVKPERKRSRVFEELQRASVINYDQFRNPATRAEYQPKSIIVVYNPTTNAEYVNALKQILTWKRDKGYEITAISTANYPTNNSIKNYIQGAYDNWENRPEYLLMVGDKGSAVSVPLWTVAQPDSYAPGNSDGDHPYVLLEGDDLLPDMLVGRISVGSGFQLTTYWNKLRNYEMQPYMMNTDWYERQLLVGDCTVGFNTSGVSTYFTTKYVKSVMERYNPNYNFTEVYEPPWPAQMQQGINQGVGFFSFRGMELMSGWSSPQDGELNNGYMLPNINVITCRTLDFNGGWRVGNLFRMGTPTAAKGVISAIGMSWVTDSAFNNLLTGSIHRGLFLKDMRAMSEGVAYAKLENYRAFWNSHQWRSKHYFQMLNLKGDPTMDVWKGVPKELNVEYPEALPAGSNSIQIYVTDANDEPVEDAWVTVRQGANWNDETIFTTGYTDSSGRITHYFRDESSGEIKVTVTKPQYKPHLGSFVVSQVGGVTYRQFTTNDDVAAGEVVNFILTVKNHSNQAVNNVSGTIATTSEFIEIRTNQSGFGNIAANTNANSSDQFRVSISPDAPAGYNAPFTLTATDNAQNSWVSRFVMVISNGKCEIEELVIEDGDNGILDPLEDARLMFRLHNIGDVDLNEIYGTLNGGGYGIELVSDTAYFGNIGVGEAKTSRDRHFSVSTSSFVIPGMTFDLDLHLFNETGFSQVIPVRLPIGTVSADDPLGPCPYGYWIYDSGDRNYTEAPEYEWIEIITNGLGRNTNLTSDFDDVQNVTTMDLPFTFRFYGEEYNVITISANGWITFIETEMGTYRNWRIPGPLGPDPIVAAFWDNIAVQNGGVCTYFDEEQRYFVIQWHAANYVNNAEEKFQIILYDPEFYYTTTTDGPIKIQYKVYNNLNNRGGQPGAPQPQYGEWGNYCTIGIGDHTGLRGLEYTFNNSYAPAANPLRNEMALYITTGSLGFTPYVAIDEVTFVDDNNNAPEFGEIGDFNVRLTNIGGEDAHSVSATLFSDDPYVTILENTSNFGNIASQGNSVRNNAYSIQIGANIPDKHRIYFTLSITCEENINWNFRFHIDVAAPNIVPLTTFVYDPFPGGNNNGLIDPGEELTIYLPVKNIGGADSPPLELNIESENPLAEINTISEVEFQKVFSGSTMYPAISVRIGNNAPIGTGLVFNYSFETGEYRFTGSFLLGVGGVVPTQLGTGDATTSVSTASPINIYFRTLRSQTVYTAEEIRAAGITSGGPISEFGYWVEGSPAYPLINFKLRMRHTDAVDAREHIGEPYQTVYSNPNYRPLAGGWDMLELDPPFVWNGEDNIMVDTAFAPVEGWGNSGQIRYYDTPNGFRYTRQDSPDQTNVETTTATNEKPQVRILIDTSAGDTSNRPENLMAAQTDDGISLTWTAPLEQQGLEGFNVYRNGTRLNEEVVGENEYVDNDYEGLPICYYYVTAVYGTGETLPSNIIAVNFGAVRSPHIMPDRGNYFEPFDIVIDWEEEGVSVHYTLDGSEPTEDDALYTEPFGIVYHTLVKAKGFREGFYPSLTAAAQYYILYAPQDLRSSGSMERLELKWKVPWSPDEEDMLVSNEEKRTRTSTSVRGESSENERQAESRNRRVNSDERSSHPQRTEINGYNIYRAPEGGDFVKLNQELLTAMRYVDTSLEMKDYRFYVTAVYGVGESQASNVVRVGPTSVDEEEMIEPLVTELLKAYPNPFNPETVIGFSLKEKDKVCIEIFDISGRRVKVLTDEVFEPGNHKLIWKGDDNRGKKLSSGIYFYRMRSSDYWATNKVLMLK